MGNAGVVAGGGMPWKYDLCDKEHKRSDISAWSPKEFLPIGLSASTAVIVGKMIYLVGGYTAAGYIKEIYAAPISKDGTVGIFTVIGELPDIALEPKAFAIADKLYVTYSIKLKSSVSPRCYVTTVKKDGSLGRWKADFKLHGNYPAIVIAKNRLYLIGGHTLINGDIPDVYSAGINEDGSLGELEVETSLPKGISYAGALVTAGKIHLLGGYSNGEFLSSVLCAILDDNGHISEWESRKELPVSTADCQIVVVKNKVYLISGRDDRNERDVIFQARITDDGNIGQWFKAGKVYHPVTATTSAIIGDTVYLYGGEDSHRVYSTINRATVRAPSKPLA